MTKVTSQKFGIVMVLGLHYGVIATVSIKVLSIQENTTFSVTLFFHWRSNYRSPFCFHFIGFLKVYLKKEIRKHPKTHCNQQCLE